MMFDGMFFADLKGRWCLRVVEGEGIGDGLLWGGTLLHWRDKRRPITFLKYLSCKALWRSLTMHGTQRATCGDLKGSKKACTLFYTCCDKSVCKTTETRKGKLNT